MILEEKYKPKKILQVVAINGWGGGGGGGPNRSKIMIFLGIMSLYFLNRRFR